MTQISYPFSHTQVATTEQWRNIAQHWVETGILNNLDAFADSTGMQVKVNTGSSIIQGFYYESTAQETLPINAADATNPRIDRVILRLDLVAESIQLAVLQGVPAVSPTAPTLTQNSSRWEISLAQIAVGANVSTIAAGNVTNERKFAKNLSVVIANNVGGQNQASDVITKLTVLTSKVIDYQNEWNGSTFTAKETGVYLVRAFVDWASTVPTNSSAIYVYKNGANYNVAITVVGANFRYVTGSCLVQLNAGDTLEIYTLQSSSGTQKTLAAARLEIARI